MKAVLLLLGGATALVVPSAKSLHSPAVHGACRTVQPSCVATTDDEKALLAASKKVTLVAKKFGTTQGKQAQKWVEQAVQSGDVNAEGLMEMQLALFEECKLDDESGRCKDLSDAIEALVSAVEERKNKPKSDEPEWQFGPTAIQTAATSLRAAATKFGPEQKQAADAWIKKIANGKVSSGEGLLEEQIVLFGECILSEGSTPSNCRQLEEALSELQAAIDERILPSEAGEPEVVMETAEESTEEVAEAEAAETTEEVEAPVVKTTENVVLVGVVEPTTGRKRKAVKQFLKKLVGKAE